MDKTILHQVIDASRLDSLPDEWGVVIHCQDPKSIGYATTLTPDVIKQAASKHIDLLVTHHDAWDFMYEEQAEAHSLLEKHHISHIWCHTPLDEADFGTAAAFMDLLGCKVTGKFAENCGRAGELPGKMAFADITETITGHTSESPCRLYDAKRTISRLACVPGGGMMVDYLREALAFNIDLYITGETSLYLLEYARFRGVSALVYSHNYTEIFGTRNLARKIADQLSLKDMTRLDEPHF